MARHIDTEMTVMKEEVYTLRSLETWNMALYYGFHMKGIATQGKQA